MKKVISLLISVCMLISLVPTMVFAGPIYFNQGDFKYRTNTAETAAIIVGLNDGVTITDLELPTSVSYGGKTYEVYAIDNSAFGNDLNIESVYMPDTYTTVLINTFFGCRNLKEVTLSNNLTGTLQGTFQYCSSLEECIIPSGVTKLDKTFKYCTSIETVEVPASVEQIAEIFDGCNKDMSTINIITPEGSYAETYFRNLGCTINGEGNDESEEEGPAAAGTVFTDGDFTYTVNANTDTVTLTSIAAEKLTGDVTVDSKASDENYTYTVTQLGDAFKNKGEKTAEMTSLELPDTITKFTGTATFLNCVGLESIHLPKNLTGDATDGQLSKTFYGCTELTEVELPAGITKCLGTFASGSGVRTVTITGTAQVDFYGSSGTQEERAWDDGTTGITIYYPENGAEPSRTGTSFTATVETYEISGDEPGGDEPGGDEEPDDVDPAEIYTYTVLSEEDKTIRITGGQSGVVLSGAVTIPSEIDGYAVVSIGNAAFGYGLFRDVTSVVVPDSVKRIEDVNAFYGCNKITHITLPEEMEYLGTGAFTGCTALTSIVVPKGVTKLSKTFRRCTSLKNITIPSSVTEIDASVFASTDGGTDIMPGITIKCAIGSYAEQYANSKGMNVKFSDGPLYSYEENDDETITITALAEDVEIIGTLTVPETYDDKTVTGIGDEAFKDREDIVGITLPETVNSIGVEAFAGCTNLTSFIVPEGVTTLEDTFLGCTSLATVTIPASVTSISEETFFTYDGEPIPRLVIYCMEESAAEIYAEENDIEYVADRVIPDGWDGTVDVDWYDPDESEYFISTAAELAGLRELVNNGTELFHNKTIILTDDINMEGTVWKIGIGYSAPSTAERSFNGIFDGGGYRIFNFTYDSTAEEDTVADTFIPDAAAHNYHGMFGLIGSFGKVMNLGFENASVTAGSTDNKVSIIVGIIAARNNGTIEHCYINNGTLAGGFYGSWCDHVYGGVAANNYGTIQDVFVKNIDFTGVVAQINSTRKAGIAGGNAGTIKDCYVYNPIYDNGNGFYTWDESGAGVGQAPIMFYYDPITTSNSGTVKNVYSSDSLTRNGWTVGTHPYTGFTEMTDKMESAMEMLTFRTIAHSEISISVEKIDGDLAGIAPEVYLEFTQSANGATITDEVIILTKSGEVVDNSINVTEADNENYPYSCTIEFNDDLEWHNDYEITVTGVKDFWNREIDSATVEFSTTDEIVCEEFALYENYGESNERRITSLDQVSGPVTAVIKGLKNNGTATYDAVFSVGAISDGQIVSGATKVVRIGAGETKTSDVYVGNINVSAFTAEDLEMQAVLYKAFNNVVPLISSVEATK